MQYDIGLPVLKFSPDEVPALGSGDVGCKGNNAGDGLNGDEINTCEVSVPYGLPSVRMRRRHETHRQ